MAKVTLNDITTEFRGQAQINNNFTAIEDEFQNKVLYRNNPVGEPNSMMSNLDMNGFNLLNVGNPTELGISNATSVNIPYENSASGAIVTSVYAKLSETISVKDFGAKGDGVTDDTIAIKMAFSAARNKSLFFPAGTYVCSEVTISYAVKVIGEFQYNSIIYAANTTSNIWIVKTTNKVDIENLRFSSASTQTSGAYLMYSPNSSDNFGSCIKNCRFTESNYGIQFVKAEAFVVDNCYFEGYNYGVEVANTSNPTQGNSVIQNCIFNSGEVNVGIAIKQLSASGLRVINNKIQNGEYGYLGQYNSAPTNTSILLIQNNSLENQSVSNIKLESLSSTTFSQVIMEGNQITVSSGDTGILLYNSGYDYIDSVNISDNLFNLSSNSIGVNVGRGSRISILPNCFYGNGTNETAITFGAAVDSADLYPQVTLDCTTNIGGTLGNVTFYSGVSQAGSVSATASASYGSLYTTALQNVAFPLAFPVVPKVQATVNSKTGGGLSASVYDVSAGGFNIVMFGITSGGVVNANWFATL